MKTKLISIITTLTMCAALLPCIAHAENYINYNDKLIFDKDSGLITAVDQEITGDIVIPDEIEGVTVTGVRFGYCKNITSVTIPESVTEIGESAFEGCTSLASVTLPQGITSLGTKAFYECESLKGITLGNRVTEIGHLAFKDCTSLESVNIPAGVTAIGENAFGNCGSLIITVDENNNSYSSADGVLFNKNKTKLIAYAKDKVADEYIIPDSVEAIGDCAFYECLSLIKIEIPESVRSIGEYAFWACEKLGNITIPKNITAIEEGTFTACNFTEVNIPEGVTSIGKFAFDGCKNLTELFIPSSVTTIGDYAFNGCESLKEVVIPNGVTRLDDFSFFRCVALESFALPESVTYIGQNSFGFCQKIQNVYYGGSEEQWNNIDFTQLNYNLTNVAPQCNYTLITAEPPEKEADKVKFDVTLRIGKTADLEKVRLYAAEYNSSAVTNVYFGENSEVQDGKMTVTADIPVSSDFKLMLWDGNNKPLIAPVTELD